ncbi:hypothetical protein GGR54DRAFT_619010 [Hypoxylon sp. NC1633]|nr:hypothetical protein GGR54DRAFT_619010 [Hypoxylon sp. NC1633]
MDNNMCGPSNAAKGLTRHLEQDRSLQRDRATVRPTVEQATQGFRRLHLGDSSGDQHFSTFQQATGPIFNEPHSGFWTQRPSVPYHADPSTRVQPQGNSTLYSRDWATDFNHTYTNPSFGPLSQTDGFSQANQQHGADVPHQYHGFNQPLQVHGFAQPNHPSFMPYTGYSSPPGFAVPSMISPVSYYPSSQQVHFTSTTFGGPPHGHVDQFDFDAELNSWMTTNSREPEHRVEKSPQDRAIPADAATVQQATSASTNAESLTLLATLVEGTDSQVGTNQATTTEANQEASADAIPQEKMREVEDQELAMAAQQIIDSVADNQSEKFKGSEFLQMMRKIASQDLVVRDNALVAPTQSPIAEDPAKTTAAFSPDKRRVIPKPVTVEDASSSES